MDVTSTPVRPAMCPSPIAPWCRGIAVPGLGGFHMGFLIASYGFSHCRTAFCASHPAGRPTSLVLKSRWCVHLSHRRSHQSTDAHMEELRGLCSGVFQKEDAASREGAEQVVESFFDSEAAVSDEEGGTVVSDGGEDSPTDDDGCSDTGALEEESDAEAAMRRFAQEQVEDADDARLADLQRRYVRAPEDASSTEETPVFEATVEKKKKRRRKHRRSSRKTPSPNEDVLVEDDDARMAQVSL
jgi:hypothetical protein